MTTSAPTGTEDVVYVPVSRAIIEAMRGRWSRPCRYRFKEAADGSFSIEVYEDSPWSNLPSDPDAE